MHLSNDLSTAYSNKNNTKDNAFLCSTSINKTLKKEKNLVPQNNLILPEKKEQEEENEINKKMNELKEIKYKLDKSIIDEIKSDSKNKTLIQEIKNQFNIKYIITSLNSPQYQTKYENIQKNKLNLSGLPKSDKKFNLVNNFYTKKTVKIKSDSKEKKFIQNINELNNIYINIEKNQHLYYNFNQKFYNLIEEINDKFIEMEAKINVIKKEITEQINNYFSQAENLINLRRKEIFGTFQYYNYDISELINMSLIWMKTVKEEKNELKITNLINSGKELNNKYDLIKEINYIYKLLEEYKENGINIIKNECNKIPIIIKENKELIKLLNLKTNKDITKDNIIIKNKENNNDINIGHENDKIYCKKIIEDKIRHNYTVSDFYKNKTSKVFKSMKQDKKDINNNSLNYNRISVSKIKNNLNINTESNETSLPFLHNLVNINSGNSVNDTFLKSKNISEYKKRHESIQVNHDTDNNININFNGNIFNYNSDSNISVVFPENNKNENNDRKKNEKKIFKNKRRTPQKIGIKKKFENQKLKRSFSFKEKNNKENKYIKINRKNHLPNTSNNTNIINKFDNIILKGINKEKKKNIHHEKTFTNIRNNKKGQKNKNNYKILNNKELEKYVNYQLKKIKQNFSRINLSNYGIKLISSYFKWNKNQIYKEIKLQGCNLNDNDLEVLIKSVLENNITISVLNISDNDLTDASFDLIIQLLDNNKEIKNLILINNSFSKKIKDKLKEFCKNKKEELHEFNIRV